MKNGRKWKGLMKRRRVKVKYTQEHGGEHTGSGVQKDRAFSPFSLLSCVTAVGAGILAAAGIVPSILTAGSVPENYAVLGLCGMPTAIFGLWLGIKGKYDRVEKRQTAGLVGCVANAAVYIVLASIYGAGLFLS